MQVMNANGTGSVPLFSPDAGARPVWSPDGNSVAVWSWPDGNPRPGFAVARLDVNDGLHDGEHRRRPARVLAGLQADRHARYLPAGGDAQIRVVNADGTGDTPVILETGSGCAYREFNEGLWWLSDGRLLYMCGPGPVTINPDGSGRTAHGTVPFEAIMYDADLSPEDQVAGPVGDAT